MNQYVWQSNQPGYDRLGLTQSHHMVVNRPPPCIAIANG